jgi:Tat protein secretion system quality control protein TatD with DNase activity
MRNVSEKYGGENQNMHFMFNNFFLEVVPFVRLSGKILHCWTGTSGNIKWCMHFTCWIGFHGSNGYANVPHCYVIGLCTLPFLLPLGTIF